MPNPIDDLRRALAVAHAALDLIVGHHRLKHAGDDCVCSLVVHKKCCRWEALVAEARKLYMPFKETKP